MSAVCAAAALAGLSARANTIGQSLGGYRDTDGTTRQRLGLDLGHEAAPGGTLSASTVNLAMVRDTYEYKDVAENDYLNEVYGSSYRTNQQATLSLGQTWEKITETRVMGSYSDDGAVRVRSWAAGVSRWIAHETLRLSLDASKTVIDQPLFSVLDFDSVQVGTPAFVSSRGMTAAVRHLATPTTVVDYSASRVESLNRPVTAIGGVAVRQFVTPADGALHVAATRADNRGKIGTDTNYGQVDAWIAETAWLQNLWRGATGRLGYRWYREDETTRAYEDHKVYGSDLVSVGLVQAVAKGSVDRESPPYSVKAAGARYVNNTGMSAQSYELGLEAKF